MAEVYGLKRNYNTAVWCAKKLEAENEKLKATMVMLPSEDELRMIINRIPLKGNLTISDSKLLAQELLKSLKEGR